MSVFYLKPSDCHTCYSRVLSTRDGIHRILRFDYYGKCDDGVPAFAINLSENEQLDKPTQQQIVAEVTNYIITNQGEFQ